MKHQQVTCPHCQKEGSSNVMKTWHFDRCKLGPNLRPERRLRAVKEVQPKENQDFTVTYYVILPDRSVHPTAYSLLYNAEFAIANGIMIKSRKGMPATGLKAKGMPGTGGVVKGTPGVGKNVKGTPKPKLICEYCSTSCSAAMLKRWHQTCINKLKEKQ
jgi:endogenous inhibitor of DNA gyrase (YacG/DUF329 family)